MFSKSFKDYFKNPVIPLPYILFTLIIQILSSLFTNPSAMRELENINENTDPAVILNALGPVFMFLLTLIILGVFLSPIILGWTYSMSRDAVEGERVGFVKGFKNSFRYYFRLLGSSIIVGLIFLGVIFIFGIFCVPMIISLSKGESMAPIAGIIILMLLMMLVILVLSIVLLPLPILLVYDDLGIDEGFKTSFKFGFKKFFHILGPLMLLIFIVVVISLPIGIWQMVNGTTASPTLSLIMSLIGSYLSLFMGVYIMNLYREYKNQGIKREKRYDEPLAYVSDNTTENASNDKDVIDPMDENKDSDNNNFIV